VVELRKRTVAGRSSLAALATASLDTLDEVAVRCDLPGRSDLILAMMAAGFGQMHV
jgi:hypothetical protein